ncbi:hypothetical protein DFH08DRAFT_808299 [Mycena albidolilacea]|uniref:Uncharacterized protein n=1 Tax=Mycena albidolilacea TaxID=1033008 RepID=A0AAD7ESH3_9AGAR|nr:hypothetical protein DFH08DRAFT_808299 [Mycena albidolilacea]
MSVRVLAQIPPLWDDHAGQTHNATLSFDRTSFAMGRLVKTAWYAIHHTIDGDSASLALDPAAGITTMRFEVKGADRGSGWGGVRGAGWVCVPSVVVRLNNDLLIRNGFNHPTRVFLEREVKEGTDITPPTQPLVVAGGAYLIWSIDTIGGAEVDGEKFSAIDTHSVADLV